MPRASRKAHEGFEAHHRRAVLQVLLVLTAVCGAAYVVINLRAEQYVLMVIELLMTVFACTLLFVIRGTRHLKAWTIVFIIPFYSVMMYGFYSPETEITVFGWVLVIPLLAHLLLGRRLGAAVSVFFVGVAGVLFLYRFGGDAIVQAPGSIANIAMATATVFALSHFYEASREQAERRLSEMAMTDSLTGLPNRAYLEQLFEDEKQWHMTAGTPLSLLMVDLDFFKQVNDRHGHDAGDAALRAIAGVMRDNLREHDTVGRLGGEEFAILLSDTDVHQGLMVAEGLRRAIASHGCHHQAHMLRLTASLGVATLSLPDETFADLLCRADRCLYRAKHAGRNRVVADTTTAAPSETTPSIRPSSGATSPK
ncbi:diguanylate cyclase [Salinisphaera orenii MK-B5]|uniref:diguanylate cyclase n=2 Tax=Salinisphaera TaxID=180541 RepID=A0A423PY43_9GAMM|nr:diguanylate cyclase [Salinisphaera orenii MK-B5]